MPPILENPQHSGGPLLSSFVDEDSTCYNYDIDEESLLLLHSTTKTTGKRNSMNYSSLTIRQNEESSLTLSSSSEDGDDSGVQPNSKLIQTFLSWLWSCYYKSLQKRPLLVKSITAFFLMGIADCFAQIVEILKYSGSTFHIDWLRAFRFAIFGLVGAPWTHYYYDWLDTVLPPTPKPWTWTTAIKVIIDQFVQAPILLALIIMGMSLMEGHGLAGMMADMKRQYVSTLIQNWKLWIPATIVNIAFVRPELRVLYDNLIFFGWTIILSMILNGAEN